jgi:TolB-like protein/Flp pilus assembly protein TadD
VTDAIARLTTGILSQPTDSGARVIRQRAPRRYAVTRLLLVVSLFPGAARSLPAQCPDGTPPPCARAARPAANSLAVLPFESVGGDTANIYFAQGLADELTTALARVPGLRVAASSSAFSFGGGGADARRVGRALRVGAVLEGRVRRDGNRLRVVARLTDTQSGLLLWTNSYEREARDVFAVQDELARDIVTALQPALRGGRAAAPLPLAAAPARGVTRNPAAYDLYLRGRFFLVRRGPFVARSIPYFEQAIALDPDFARAWAQLGIAWSVLPLYSPVRPDTAMPRARFAYETALRLDPASAEAHTAAGFVRMFAGDWPGAAAQFERAIALDSAYPEPHRPYTSTLGMMGRIDDAIAQGRRALALDPVNSITASVLCYMLVAGRRYEEAVAIGRRGVELDSTSPLAWSNIAVAELFAGRRDRALAAVNQTAWIPNTVAPIAYVIGATASRDSVASLVRRLEGERDNASAVTAIAWAWLAAGDTARALDALERMARDRAPVAFQSAFSHPAYDPVRGSTRFAAVVRSYGLDERSFAPRPHP